VPRVAAIDAVVFDVGGVVLDWDRRRSLEEFGLL
jgi:hypothetical protein